MPDILAVDQDAFYYAPYPTEQYDHFLADPHTQVSLARTPSGTVVGHSVVRLHQDEHASPASDKAYLDTVGVRYAHHGQKIGLQLTLSALSACTHAGISTAILCVRENNDPALHLYGKLGFEPTGKTETEIYEALGKKGVYMELGHLQSAAVQRHLTQVAIAAGLPHGGAIAWPEHSLLHP
jgi:ribosomal protein S18 acetylase RimI-like enzyme